MTTRTTRRGGLIAAALVVAATSTPASAGITDAVPVGYKSVWVVPGVTNNINQATTFVCVAHAATTIGVQVYDAPGAGHIGQVLGIALSPGQAATVITSTVLALGGATSMSIGSTFQGSARVLVQGGKVSCSARVTANDGSGAGYALPVVKASGQKGQ